MLIKTRFNGTTNINLQIMNFHQSISYPLFPSLILPRANESKTALIAGIINIANWSYCAALSKWRGHENCDGHSFFGSCVGAAAGCQLITFTRRGPFRLCACVAAGTPFLLQIVAIRELGRKGKANNELVHYYKGYERKLKGISELKTSALAYKLPSCN